MKKRISICADLAFLTLALITASPALVAADEYSHRIWRVEDGLPRNRIQAIEQTPDGYLWIATPGGLARFDGVRFVVFDSSNTPALSDESVTSLWPARDGSLWAGTEGGGLLHYRNGSFTNFGTAQGLTNGFIRSVFEDKEGTLWVGADRGFFRLVNDRFVRLDGTPEVPLASVVKILADRDGQIRVATSVGLLNVAGGKLVHATCRGEVVSTSVRGIYEAADGRLLSIEAEGFTEVREGCRARSAEASELQIRTVGEDHDGNLWIGTLGDGLLRYRNGKPALFSAPSVLPDNGITAIFEDRERNMWVGTQDGLLLLSKTALTTIGTADGMKDDHVTSIYADPRGIPWIATLSGQLYRIIGDKPVPVPLPGMNLRAFKPNSVLEDSRGSLWLGSNEAGAMHLDRGVAIPFTMKEGMRSNSIRQIYEDDAGQIWFATGSGLTRWDGQRLRNFYLDDGLSYPSVRCIAPNPGGGFLIGTDGGLSLWRDGALVSLPWFAALRQEKIWAILADPDGTLWLGTRGAGLIRVRSGRLTRYTVREGLISNSIFQILDDGKGKLWLSGPVGVSSVLRQELTSAADGRPSPLHSVPYGTTDGMLTSQMNGGLQPAGARSGSGDLWFPSLKGAVRIDPAKLPSRESMPVLIEQVMAGDRSISLENNIVIPPGQPKLEIAYTVCNLTAPSRLSFRYKLEGFDDHWVSALRNRAAYYTNLPPGHYRFVVEATDSVSPLRTTQAAIALDLRPSFYQTAWFYGSGGLLFALGLFGASRFYTRQTKSRYALLLSERTRLAREMHDTVIQGCVGVSTLLEAAGRLQHSDPEEAAALLGHAKVQVKATLEEARQAVWDLRSPVASDSGVASLIDLAQRLGTENAIRVETEIRGSRPPLDPELDRTLLLVGREALRNAVAHGRASRISLRIVFRALEVVLEVKDDGAGFAPGEVATDGVGHFGILGMRERVAQLGGTFTLDSAAGTGTTLMARIPLGRSGKTPMLAGDAAH